MKVPLRARYGLRTLRGRLLLVMIAATVLGLFIMGFASVSLLESSLVHRTDDKLNELSRPMTNGHRPPPGPPPPDHERDLPTEFRAQTFDLDGRPVGQPIGRTETDAGQPLLMRHDLVPGRWGYAPDSRGGAMWRVHAVRAPDGRTIVLSLSMYASDLTVRWLASIELVVGAVVVLVLAAVATVLVRLGLRPLTRIEHTAHAIATGDLDRRIADQDPSTETGRLGAALNTMLGRVVSALQEREQSEHRLRRFVADASHELRTPLTSIRGFAELYRRSEAPREGDVALMMSRIESEAVRMGDLVEDLLLLARLDRERAIDLVDQDLVELVRDIVHDARARDADREITLHVPDGSLRVLADGHRLRQVLHNLVTNALVHTTSGSPVRVEVRHGAPSGEACTASAGADVAEGAALGVVEVADSGPGIEAEHAERIFDRFYRVADGRERAEGGTGLGLAITAAIAEAHNGRVELVSNEAGGSTFRLLIPMS